MPERNARGKAATIQALREAEIAVVEWYTNSSGPEREVAVMISADIMHALLVAGDVPPPRRSSR